MKRFLALCASVVMMLLAFVSCGEEEKLMGEFFIGTAEAFSDDTFTVNVYSEFSDTYGQRVEVSIDDLGGYDLDKGDEVRVYVSEYEDGKVTASGLKVLLYYSDNEANSDSVTRINGFNKVVVPNDFPKFNGDVPSEVVDKNCFGYSIYRVVKQEENRTYLAYYNSIKVSYVIVGDMTDRCTTGDFVYATASRCEEYSYQYAVYEQYLTDLCVVDTDELEDAVNLELPTGDYDPGADWLKPVIYLYPEETVTVNVSLEVDGEVTCTYPDYDGGKGWRDLTVSPDGTVTKDGREYYCLYWEGEGFMETDFPEGFCVKGGDTAEFLEKALKEIGLTDREANEFIIYWLPVLQENEYNLISFQGQNYTDAAQLEIAPQPDSVLRVFMSYKPLEEPIEIEPQTFDGFERNGFTVVEWGGGMAK